MTRTRELLITNQLHYRLCYTSKFFPDYSIIYDVNRSVKKIFDDEIF